MKTALLKCATLLLGMTTLSAEDKMLTTQDAIHVISAFDQWTFLTAYSLSGDPIWEAPFKTEILAWEIKDHQMLIFSRSHNGLAYFLTSLDAKSGAFLWEKPIVAPDPEQS